MQIWVDLEGHLIPQWNINFKKNNYLNKIKKIKNRNKRSCQKKCRSGIILRLKRKNPQIP
jgi:hypothetical protein